MNSIIENNKQAIIELCKRHHVKFLYIFGSVTRDDFNNDSDIDFLYEFDTSRIDFDNLNNAEYDYVDNLFSFKEKLENLLQRKIDLIPIKAVKNKYFINAIENDKQIVYAAEQVKEVSY